MKLIFLFFKKSLKIPKISKSKKRRQHNGQKKKDKRTNNIMTKQKRTKEQTTIYKTLHIKLKIEQQEPR
jgi:hypothetical protein